MSAPAIFRPHRPSLTRRPDGRFEVRCGDCLARRDEAPPIGIGIPVAREYEAVEILRNHVGGWAVVDDFNAGRLPANGPEQQRVIEAGQTA